MSGGEQVRVGEQLVDIDLTQEGYEEEVNLLRAD